jgi:hypothetical protein
MSQAQTIEAVRGRYMAQVATPGGIDTVYDNGPALAGDQPVARVTVTVRDERQLTLGRPRRWRTVGEMEVRLQQPRERGDAAVLTLAETVVGAFRGVELSSPFPIRFFPPPTVSGALDIEAATVTRVVRVPFQADYTI